MFSHRIEPGRWGVGRELGVVFNEVDGSVSQTALNYQLYKLSHSTYCDTKNQKFEAIKIN